MVLKESLSWYFKAAATSPPLSSPLGGRSGHLGKGRGSFPSDQGILLFETVKNVGLVVILWVSETITVRNCTAFSPESWWHGCLLGLDTNLGQPCPHWTWMRQGLGGCGVRCHRKRRCLSQHNATMGGGTEKQEQSWTTTSYSSHPAERLTRRRASVSWTVVRPELRVWAEGLGSPSRSAETLVSGNEEASPEGGDTGKIGRTWRSLLQSLGEETVGFCTRTALC